MSNKKLVNQEDLLGVMFRTGPDDFPFDTTYGLWYVFLNNQRGISTTKNSNHSWLRICGTKVVGKGAVEFDPVVEPIFLRSTNSGSLPDCVAHGAHPHATHRGCVLSKDAFVWINVNRSMEPNIRDYEKSTTLDSTPHFCEETDSVFLKSFIYWLSDQGGRYDLSRSGL